LGMSVMGRLGAGFGDGVARRVGIRSAGMSVRSLAAVDAAAVAGAGFRGPRRWLTVTRW
jgi:hypothetical protein